MGPAAPPTRDAIPGGYGAFFAEVAARVRAAHLKAAAAVNRELITLYCDLGREIVQRQQREGWGAGVLARLAADLRREFPGTRGFSERNVRSARAFCLAYASPPEGAREAPANRQQPVAEIGVAAGSASPAAATALPWGHNLLLLEKLDDPALRLWYADQTTNFAATLPPPQSDLAREVVKDPTTSSSSRSPQGARERRVEAGVVAHMREFLLELGTGFLYAGSQYRLVVGGDEFFLDLLFYHKRLRCRVVLDLKTGEFRPAYAGKMHFYLNVVDDQLRDPGDQPSVGLILCRSKNAVVAEYAPRGVASPVGVAEYRVTDATEALPAELRAALPRLEAVRAELAAAPLDEGPSHGGDVPRGAEHP